MTISMGILGQLTAPHVLARPDVGIEQNIAGEPDSFTWPSQYDSPAVTRNQPLTYTAIAFFNMFKPWLDNSAPKAAQIVIAQVDEWTETRSLDEVNRLLSLLTGLEIEGSLECANRLDVMLALLASTKPLARRLPEREAFATALSNQLESKFGAKTTQLVLRNLI